MLSGPRSDRLAEWGVTLPPTGFSSPGEELPPYPVMEEDLSRTITMPNKMTLEDSPMIQDASSVPPPFNAQAGSSKASGAIGMEKQSSSTGSIGGIEWVDWMDSYKMFKAAKIRAEQEKAAAEVAASSPPTIAPVTASVLHSPTYHEGSGLQRHLTVPAESTIDESAISLTPTTSRDEYITPGGGNHGQMGKRSMSIRSTLSSLDPRMSPIQKRNSMFERQRQSSGSSARSSVDASGSSSSGVMRPKKNLVAKMEGWWNAVKSNFTEPPNAPHRPSNLGAYVQHRIPSAPQSRRESQVPSVARPDPVHLSAPTESSRQEVRRSSGSGDSNNSLRQAVSHADLRSRNVSVGFEALSLQDSAQIHGSKSADLAKLSRQASVDMPPPPNPEPSRDLSGPQQTSPAQEDPPMLAPRSSSGLEARRKQPQLRLELEPHILTISTGTSSRTDSDSGKSMPSRPGGGAFQRASQATSRSSSYGQTLSGPGLTPGVPHWDQTPSPIFALGSPPEIRPAGGSSLGRSSVSQPEAENPVLPGSEITIASVRRHIRHRLNAAKDACDVTLKKTIDAITRYAEERRSADQDVVDDSQPDFFDGISSSPMPDVDDRDGDHAKDARVAEGVVQWRSGKLESSTCIPMYAHRTRSYI